VAEGREPGCAPFDVTLEDTTLRTSIDRAKLPDELAPLDSWTVVMGYSTADWDWSSTHRMPATLPNPLAPRPGSPTP
jgi:hypothetical protein